MTIEGGYMEQHAGVRDRVELARIKKELARVEFALSGELGIPQSALWRELAKRLRSGEIEEKGLVSEWLYLYSEYSEEVVEQAADPPQDSKSEKSGAPLAPLFIFGPACRC